MKRPRQSHESSGSQSQSRSRDSTMKEEKQHKSKRAKSTPVPGRRFHIASFGYQHFIHKILKELDLLDLFTNIFCSEGSEEFDKNGNSYGKNLMLNAILPQVPNRKRKILLLDDSQTNCELAKKEGYYAINTSKTGITYLQGLEIYALLHRHPEITDIVLDADWTLLKDHCTSEYAIPFLEQKQKQSKQKKQQLSMTRQDAQQLWKTLDPSIRQIREQWIAPGALFLLDNFRHQHPPTSSSSVSTPSQVSHKRTQA